MTSTEDHVEIEQFIPCQLAALSNAITRSVASLFEDWYDITIPEWKVMATVAKRPGLSAVHVAAYAGLDTVAVSRAVTKLMDAGRISREFCKEDRRRSILELSPEGRELYERIVPTVTRLQASLLEGLTRDERVVFGKALKSLHATSRQFAALFAAAERPDTGDDTARLAPSVTPSLNVGRPVAMSTFSQQQ